MTSDELTKLAAGLTVSHFSASATDGIAVHFTNGAAITVEWDEGELNATFRRSVRRATTAGGQHEPTSRQREYLAFIQRYMSRYGVSPAELDIQRHFLVSAPSANAMIRTLERRGFIIRGRDLWGQTVPRSIRVLVDPG
ncbi:hypothetical protein BH09GEM1_BH09GEM1_22530 [soil metagenome]